MQALKVSNLLYKIEFFNKKNTLFSERNSILCADQVLFEINFKEKKLESNLVFFNRCFDKGRLKTLISWFLIYYGEKATIELVENLKELGFKYATQAGISLSLDDLKIPPTKALVVSEAELVIQKTEIDYKKGHVTAVENFQKLIGHLASSK